MARRGYYSYERRQRDLAKATKREAKREARAAKKLRAQPDEASTADREDEPNIVRLPGLTSAEAAAGE